MRFLKWIIAFSFLILCGYVYGNENSQQIRFLAGLIILKSDGTLTPVQKVRFYSELEKITGISSEKSIEFLKSYRDKPREWKKIQDSIDIVVNGDKKF